MKSSPSTGVLAELVPWLVMLGTLAAAWSLYTVGLDTAADVVLVVTMVALFPVGIGWFLCGYANTGILLFSSRVVTFFVGGFVAYLFHSATTDSFWLDVVYAAALAPIAVHLLIVPPVSAALLGYRLKWDRAASPTT